MTNAEKVKTLAVLNAARCYVLELSISGVVKSNTHYAKEVLKNLDEVITCVRLDN